MPTHRHANGTQGGRLVVGLIVTLLVLSTIAAVTYAWRSNNSPPPTAESSPSTTPPTSPSTPAKPLVLAISVDGLNPEAITRLGQSGVPNLHRLIKEGASTLNARAAFELTITLPNHTGMLTGRRVAGPDGHGVTFNNDNSGTLNSTHNSYVPGLFDVAHDQGLNTAFFAEKDKFHYLIRSWDPTHGAPDTSGEDNGRDKLDIEAVGDDPQMVAATQTALTDGKTDLIFLHLRAPDDAGHAKGWLGPDYLKAVQSVDRDIGSILTTIDGDAQTRERVTILLTADHGGPEGLKKHSDATRLANYRVPFIAWGRGVAEGTDFYQLNAGRLDPQAARPGYDAVQPIRNLDIAGTALSVLGLPSIQGAIASSWPPLRLK